MRPRTNEQEYQAMRYAELVDAYLRDNMTLADADDPVRRAALEDAAREYAREAMTEHPALTVGERQR